MKYLHYIAALLLTTATLSAQEVKLKKEVVYVDGVETFSFDKKSMGSELHVYKLNTKEELVNMSEDNNKTESKVDDGKKLTFPQQNTIVQSKNLHGRDWNFLIALLIQEKVMDLKGTINPDNLRRFKGKYDDNVLR